MTPFDKQDKRTKKTQLSEGLNSTSILIQKLMEDIHDNDAAFLELKMQFDLLANSLDGLIHIFKGGVGIQSLETRLALIDNKFKLLSASVEALKGSTLRIADYQGKDTKRIDSLFHDVNNRMENCEKLIEERVQAKFTKKQITIERMKIFAAMSPGLFAMILWILKIIFENFN